MMSITTLILKPRQNIYLRFLRQRDWEKTTKRKTKKAASRESPKATRTTSGRSLKSYNLPGETSYAKFFSSPPLVALFTYPGEPFNSVLIMRNDEMRQRAFVTCNRGKTSNRNMRMLEFPVEARDKESTEQARGALLSHSLRPLKERPVFLRRTFFLRQVSSQRRRSKSIEGQGLRVPLALIFPESQSAPLCS